MIISLVAAMAENRVIGRQGGMPWHIPEDLRHFRDLTMGHPVIMGRKTLESIGAPLPGRLNIVVSHRSGRRTPGYVTVSSIQEGLKAAGKVDEVFIIGGEEIFRQALPLAQRVYLTLVPGEYEGDVSFPPLPPGFLETSRRPCSGQISCQFIVFEREPEPLTMRAMVFEGVGRPLRAVELPVPEPGDGEVLIRVAACGICRTDLHILDGELDRPKLPLIPGHQIVGRVVKGGTRFRAGDRVGVPWLGFTCGRCRFCTTGRENLCTEARFTGYHRDGGFAEYAVADERFCFPLPEGYPDLQAAPLLCAGLIGWRSLVMAGSGERLGIYGFGAAAHIVCQVAAWQGRKVYGFTRPGDAKGQKFARSLGAVWAGGADERPPEELDAAIIFAPAGELVPAALKAVGPGGRVVCGGIHMSDIPSFSYDLLWEERSLRSVANLTRKDGEEFLALAPRVPVHTEVTAFPLEQANEALEALRRGAFEGAGVLVMEPC